MDCRTYRDVLNNQTPSDLTNAEIAACCHHINRCADCMALTHLFATIPISAEQQAANDRRKEEVLDALTYDPELV